LFPTKHSFFHFVVGLWPSVEKEYPLPDAGIHSSIYPWVSFLVFHFSQSTFFFAGYPFLTLKMKAAILDELDRARRRGSDIRELKNVEGIDMFTLCTFGNIEKLRKYHSQKDVNVFSNYNSTPLSCAIINRRVECVKYLVNERKADVNLASTDRCPPLYYAVQSGNLECVKFLCEKGAKYNERFDAFMKAVIEGNVACVRYFVEERGVKLSSYEGRDNIRGLLHTAIFHKRFDMSVYLTENGIDVNVAKSAAGHIMHSNEKWVPLSLAIRCRQYKIVDYLIKKGAYINGTPGFDSPLKSACAKNDMDRIKLLLSNGANPFNDIEDNLPSIDYGKLIVEARETFKEKQAVLWMLCVRQHIRIGPYSSLKLLPADIIRRLHMYLV
jgi:ankyrin repeat protein